MRNRIIRFVLTVGILTVCRLGFPVFAQSEGLGTGSLSHLWENQIAIFEGGSGSSECQDAQLDIIEYIRDNGIQQSVVIANAYVHLGRKAEAQGRYRDAFWAFQAALIVDPDHTEAANAAVFAGFRSGIGTGFSALFRRASQFVRQFLDLRLSMIQLGNLSLAFQAAIALVVSAVVIIILIRQFPLIVNEIQHHLPSTVDIRITSAIVAILLLTMWVTPLRVFGTLATWLALALAFSAREHRVSLWIMWCLLLFLVPLTYLHVFSITISENRLLKIRDFVMTEGYSQPAVDELHALVEAKQNERNVGKLHFMLGLMYKRGGFYSDAKTHYQAFIDGAPREAAGYINLGNIVFIEDQIKTALELYRRAEKLDPRNPVIYYNLSMAYMSQFRFDDAREMQNRATRLDRERVQRFSEAQSSKPVRMMVDESVPAEWFNDEVNRAANTALTEFQQYWRPRFIRMNLIHSAVLWICMTGVLIFVRLIASRIKLSRFCLKCGNPMRPDAKTGGTDCVCVDCHMIYFKKTAGTTGSRDMREHDIKRMHRWNTILHRIFSCLAPGGGRIYSGKFRSGLLMMIPWAILLGSLLLDDFMLPLNSMIPARASHLGFIFIIVFLVLDYGVSIFWGFREEDV
ncbi:tetratricopeptide repeat protein [bacterium]|nr:tetratricopeptide repeat protein [candidate division CSSED10-310 bacterium]